MVPLQPDGAGRPKRPAKGQGTGRKAKKKSSRGRATPERLSVMGPAQRVFRLLGRLAPDDVRYEAFLPSLLDLAIAYLEASHTVPGTWAKVRVFIRFVAQSLRLLRECRKRSCNRREGQGQSSRRRVQP